MKDILGSAMRRSKQRKSPALHPKKPSRETSPRCSSVLSDWDADDEGFMSSGDLVPSRPPSLSITAGPYCPRRPTLHEVLANTAPPPWTLSAFMAYLSQNHCLETLEFTIDAQRYAQHYNTMVDRASHNETRDLEYVRMLWQKLLDAYITPNGPREVNLPSDVRDRLLSLPSTYAAPDPVELEPAVKIIYELMDESVLVPFLNSVTPTRPAESLSLWGSDESMTDLHMAAPLDDRALSRSRSRAQREGSPPMGGNDFTQHHLTTTAGRPGPSRLSALISASSITSADAVDSMTDDSTDSPSPSGSALEPMTPPNTPPTSNIGFEGPSHASSQRPVRHEGSSWRKMSAKLGWKKSRSGASTSGSHHPMGRGGSDDSGSSEL
jgi:hypothetical protein